MHLRFACICRLASIFFLAIFHKALVIVPVQLVWEFSRLVLVLPHAAGSPSIASTRNIWRTEVWSDMNFGSMHALSKTHICSMRHLSGEDPGGSSVALRTGRAAPSAFSIPQMPILVYVLMSLPQRAVRPALGLSDLHLCPSFFSGKPTTPAMHLAQHSREELDDKPTVLLAPVNI